MYYIGKSYVTTVTMEKNLITLKKKYYKCMQMHYIGKSYVTTVYKFDDGFLWQKLLVDLWDSHLIFDLTQLVGVGESLLHHYSMLITYWG